MATNSYPIIKPVGVYMVILLEMKHLKQKYYDMKHRFRKLKMPVELLSELISNMEFLCNRARLIDGAYMFIF